MTVKPRTHFVLDTLIFITFVVTMISGLVLWFALGSGYQGGRNPAAAEATLLMTRWMWRDVHNWFGLAMGVLAALHAVLHLPWIVCMVKRMLGLDKGRRSRKAAPPGEGIPDEVCPI